MFFKRSPMELLNKLNTKDRAAVENFVSKTMEKMEKEKKTLQEILGVSDETLENLYSSAYAFYNQGHYEKSRHYFQILVTSSPKNPKYLFGLAASYYQLKNYEDASSLFIATLYQDTFNAEAAFYAGECFVKRGEIEAALYSFNLAIAISDETGKFLKLKEKCLLIKKSLQSKK